MHQNNLINSYKYVNHAKYLNLNNPNKILNKLKFNNSIKYTIRFSSIIAPSKAPRLSLINMNSSVPNKKLHIKQSYMLMTWMTYLRDFKKGSNNPMEDLNNPSIFAYPSRTITFTHTKAPMAHKTFSQEQFKFKFYFLGVSFRVNIFSNLHSNDDITSLIDSVNKSLYILLKLRSESHPSATNLFFIKKFDFDVPFEDYSFLNINKF